MSVRVLLADDHRLILAGIRRALEQVGGIEIVGEALKGSQVLPLVHQTEPDVVLLDLRLPDMSGLTCLEGIRERYPHVKVVMLSAASDPENVEAAFERGAAAYIVKSVSPVDLPSALREALEERVRERRVIGETASGSGERLGLTEREFAVLEAVARGLSNQQIAKEFWVTEQTVKFHLRNVYRKLGVANRTEAAHYAYRHGVADGIPTRTDPGTTGGPDLP